MRKKRTAPQLHKITTQYNRKTTKHTPTKKSVFFSIKFFLWGNTCFTPRKYIQRTIIYFPKICMKKNILFKTLATITLSVVFFQATANTSAYMIGVKSWDNSIKNIKRVEETIGLDLPLVSFIFHTRDHDAYNTVSQLPYELGKNKIYHITLAPDHMTAQEVADGKADEIYINFFELVRDTKIKVVFRTMHEMNGWWYPRSSNPEAFKQARIRVRELSRKAWLTKKHILFDMSVNAWDMPTTDARPNQKSPLMYCYPSQKSKLNCSTFEDYYPGNDYVDILGFTFYNRGKGNTNRERQAPYEIANNKNRRTLDRLKTFNKPLFLDEVGTTAVRYAEQYNQQKSIEVFQNEMWRKNARLDSLKSFLENESSIIGTIYFNVDLTYWLTNRMIGEADRSIFDPATGKVYESGKKLFNGAVDNKALYTSLYSAFWLQKANRWSTKILVTTYYWWKAINVLKTLQITPETPYSTAKTALEWYRNSINASTKLTNAQKIVQWFIIKEALEIITQ